MYGIRGERALLARAAAPRGTPRLGSRADRERRRQADAASDAYGQILEAAYLYARAGGELTESNWRYLTGLVEIDMPALAS